MEDGAAPAVLGTVSGSITAFPAGVAPVVPGGLGSPGGPGGGLLFLMSSLYIPGGIPGYPGVGATSLLDLLLLFLVVLGKAALVAPCGVPKTSGRGAGAGATLHGVVQGGHGGTAGPPVLGGPQAGVAD